MRGLLELRELIKVGPYMRKYDSLRAVWVEQHVLDFLPRPVRKEREAKSLLL